MREKLKYCSDPNLHGKKLNILIYSYTDKFLGENQLKKHFLMKKSMKTPTVEIVFRFTPLYFLLSGNSHTNTNTNY